MRASLVTTLQCPPPVADQYVQLLESGNLKQFKTFFMVKKNMRNVLILN